MNTQLASVPMRGQPPGVLKHLVHLTRSFVHDERHIAYINVYARPLVTEHGSALQFITARESGFEGISCVDDVARAAILALRVHERTGSTVALGLAGDWLAFVEYMQESDGRFTNFIVDDTGAKNLRGRTSYTGGGWWTARALWAFATAWRVTGHERYLDRFRRGRLNPTNDLKVKAVQALALTELYQKQPDEALGGRICALCDSIVASARGQGYFQDGRGRTGVALWGYHQLQAVARAGRLFSRLDYIAACEATVRLLIEPVIAGGFYHVYPTDRDCQCAYDLSPLVLGLAELYRVRRKPLYRDCALECASWLDGHNAAGVPLYDPHTGRCSDGVTHGVASSNCGAESSIEAGFIELARRRLRRSGGDADSRESRGRRDPGRLAVM